MSGLPHVVALVRVATRGYPYKWGIYGSADQNRSVLDNLWLRISESHIIVHHVRIVGQATMLDHPKMGSISQYGIR